MSDEALNDEGTDQLPTDEEAEYQQRLEAAVNPETKEWWSLGHRKQFYGEEIPNDGPDVYAYKEADEEKFDKDLASYKRKKEISEAVRAAISKSSSSPESSPFESDETRKEIAEQKRLQTLWGTIGALGEEGLINAPGWASPTVQRDFEKLLSNFNHEKENRELIVLPAETESFGDVKKIKPNQMVMFNLEPSVKGEVMRVSEHFRAPGRNESQRVWMALRSLGHHVLGEPTIKYPARSTGSDEKPTEDDPWAGKDGQKRFETWRKKHGAKR